MRTFRKLFFFFTLMCILQLSVQAQTLILEDLVGKWTLTKVEVVNVQNDTEIGRQTYNPPSSYPGKIYFEQVECFVDGKAAYSGQCDEGLRAGGSIQLYSNGTLDYITFHGRSMGVSFEFTWLNLAADFILISEQQLNQQQNSKERLLFYYTKN